MSINPIHDAEYLLDNSLEIYSQRNYLRFIRFALVLLMKNYDHIENFRVRFSKVINKLLYYQSVCLKNIISVDDDNLENYKEFASFNQEFIYKLRNFTDFNLETYLEWLSNQFYSIEKEILGNLIFEFDELFEAQCANSICNQLQNILSSVHKYQL